MGRDFIRAFAVDPEYLWSGPMSTVLLIDDEPHIADVVVYMLEEHGFEVVTAGNGEEGLALFSAEQPGLVLLDLNLPGKSGLEVFREMKTLSPATPIIMLTCRVEEPDRVLGLEMGADDYVTKPFSVRELAARVKVVLRRANQASDIGIVEHGPLRIEEETYTLTFHGQAIKATRAEFGLLETLASYPARVFSRDALIRKIYNDEHPVTDRTIDACVKRVRKKLRGVDASVDPIETVYGVGYKLNRELLEPGQ